MGTPFDPTNPLHNIITDEAGNPVPQKYDPEANSGQGGMVVVSTEDVQKVQQSGSIVAVNADGSIAAENVREYRGLSTDTKPTSDVPLYSIFSEMDTANDYYWDGSRWVLM